MKVLNSIIWLVLVLAVVALPSSGAFAEDRPPRADVSASAQTDENPKINLEAPDWQTVLDRLFGTPDTGLLDGTGAFQLRAEDISLTSAQAELFTSIDSPQNISTLIEAAIASHSMIRLEGTIDGQPFELKLAGRELKIEGLTLTAAQREALIAELSGIEGLHEMKIQALVDGQMTVTKFQGGHEKFEILHRGRPEHPQEREGRGHDKIEIERPGREGRELIERPVRIEKPERIEHGAPGRR
jgi:hypothetical protein